MKSVYIHIPFCKTICTYCDFCKFYYNEEWIDNYLKELKREIKLNYKGEIIDTIYIGGGTPSCLSIRELNELFDIIKLFNLSDNVEFTFECNIENITKEKLYLLYKCGVNRISIGVQTLNNKYLNFLNRNHTKEEVKNKINLTKNIGFKNINVDLIYAIPSQTLKELKQDLKYIIDLNVTHISCYSLIIEPNTKLYIDKIKKIDDDLDYEMYKEICEYLKDRGYNHYEVSNFSKEGYNSRHNLTYWNNDEYYGFGVGASGYINGYRYDNTRSLNNYLKGNYIANKEQLSIDIIIENEFILGLRKIKGINKKTFYKKYNIDIKSIEVVNKLLKEEKLLEDSDNIYINPLYIYISNEILIEFIGMK